MQNENITIYIIRVIKSSMINYSYLLLDNSTRDAILIDPAWEYDKILQVITSVNASICAVLLTHSHDDHIDLADIMAKNYNACVFMSQIEIDYYKFFCHNLCPIEEFEIFLCGSIEVLPILTQGHTKGSVCYHIGDNLFTGDTLFFEGCGLCFADGGAPEDMYESLNFLKKEIPLHTKIYPGHCYGKKPGEYFKDILKYNVYFEFDSVERFTDFRMRENQKSLFNFK